MANKQDGVQFVLCPKKGNRMIEDDILNRVCILGFFCPNQGQVFKRSAAHLLPKYWSSTPFSGEEKLLKSLGVVLPYISHIAPPHPPPQAKIVESIACRNFSQVNERPSIYVLCP